MIETSYFNISPGRYVREAITVWSSRWWWIIALPVAVFLLLGTRDARYLIISLCLILVVYPGLMMIVYFNHALRPEAAMATVPHKIQIGADGLDIIYREREGYSTPAPRHIGIDAIDYVEDTGKSITVQLKSGKYDFIEIPIEMFAAGDAAKAMSIINKNQSLA